MVKFSNISPNIIMNATNAAALYSPISSAPIIATLTITPAVRSPFRMPLAASKKIGEPPTTVEAIHRMFAAACARNNQIAA